MFQLDLDKAQETEIELRTSTGSSKKLESSRKTSTSALLTTSKLLTVWITTNWEILQEIGIPDHFTCLLRDLYAGHEATVRTGRGKKKKKELDMKQQTGSRLGKEYVKAVYCHLAF